MYIMDKVLLPYLYINHWIQIEDFFLIEIYIFMLKQYIYSTQLYV